MNGGGEFLPLLARAVQQFHTYPPTSSMCVGAVEACHHALVAGGTREQLTFRVAPRELIVDEKPFGRGTIVETELARRLHALSVAQVTFDRAISPREVGRFCEDLLKCGERSHDERTLLELLAEHGVQRINLRPAYRPEVLPVAAAPGSVDDFLSHERQRREALLATAGAVNHLYPPDKGWVRVDPSMRLDSVSLVELALLAGDPGELAHMLTRLTDGEEAHAQADALARRFSDVATLFAAMDPRLARVMFARLASAVLDLDPERRQMLLRRTILPGLLDGRIDGAVLHDFPDLDLAESLCLLLDLEAAAPEVIPAALARLDLSEERQASVMPLIEERLQSRAAGTPHESSVHAHARKLLRVDRTRVKSTAEFAAFDLALDDEARAALVEIRGGIAASDPTVHRLECVWALITIEPNPETVQRLLARAATLIGTLERDGRLGECAAWINRHRTLAETLREARPDVAEALGAALAAFCTEARARIVADLVVQHAVLLAPAIAEAVDGLAVPLQRVAARVFGIAGPGYEMVLGRLLKSEDEQTVREALRSLARIATSRAASLVAAEINRPRGWVAGAAEQTLWHFPKAEAVKQITTLLGAREFVLNQPGVAERLLDRAPRDKVHGVLGSLEGLRYRFWSPSVARVGRKAHAMLAAAR